MEANKIPRIHNFTRAMQVELEKNSHKEMIGDDGLKKGLIRNFVSFLEGNEPEKSLVDLANYAAMLWNSRRTKKQ